MNILTPDPTPGDTSWFTDARFGLFIHWGLYAQGARHEWLKNYEQMDDARYERYFKFFDPDLYDPKLWAQAASGAGMKYFVVTTKHHEGFCLWDSEVTDYKSTNTPARRDLLTPMVEAFREEQMKVGFYHSLIDWHHPDFTIDSVHPLRSHPDKEKLNEGRDRTRYAKYLRSQVEELLTKFGKVDLLWADFSYPPEKGRTDWDSENLYKLIREKMPQVILNDRLDLESGWDIKTPEQFQPRSWVHVGGKPVVWEACQTFSGSWGYHRDESSWKSLEMLVQMLIDTVSKGGNLLLNVGPTGRGEFDARALERLAGMGEWMKRHSRSIYGCTQAPADLGPAPQDCRYTFNPKTNRLYVHVLAWPFGQLYLNDLDPARVEYAQLLNDASEVLMKGVEPWQETFSGDHKKNGLSLRLPVQKPDVTVPVIELFLK
jgi:alpha-L-fucosidase